MESNERTAPASRAETSARGLSIGARLALGFGLIALLFFALNWVGQRNATLTTERIEKRTAASRQLDRVARKLTDSLAAYQRAVLGVATSSNYTFSENAQNSAEADLLSAIDEYGAIQVPSADGLPPDRLRSAVASLHESTRDLGVEAKRVDDELTRYWTAFDRLQQQLGILETTSWRVGDRVFTRRSPISVVDALVDVRRAVGTYLASPSPQRAAAVRVKNREFVAVLDRNQEAIVNLQGAAWVADVRVKFDQLREGLRSIDVTRDRTQRGVIAVSTGIQDLVNLVRAGISEPAARMLTASANEAGEIAQRTNKQISMASIALLALIVIIAFFTVASVTGPIRRLRHATLQLTAGNETARARRGGARELDQLSAAFNDMADRLADAQQAMRNDQVLLEQRVAERTEQLEHLAYHDTLTQLPNRRHLFKYLATRFRAGHTDGRTTLLLFDLDNFKTLNDSLGHLFGDQVLQAVGERLRESIGSAGFVARLGGDEFTIVCDVGPGIAAQAEALQAKFQRPLQVDGREITVSVSVGAAIYPDHGADAESLLRAADVALFKAKEFGRNRACVANAQLVEQIGRQFKTEQALRRAAQSDELLLQFQPQINLSKGKVQVVEALVRWKRGDVYIAPMDFLPLAAQSGLIMEITDWVLKSAIVKLAEWRRGPWPQARIGVNISSQQFMEPAFVAKLQSLLLLHAVPPSSLELELTETALQSGSATIDTLRELRNLGVGIALDDFGAGYSSLASLEQLSLSRVKIDRSLIENVDRDPRSTSIARSIVDLCRSLNLEVTVEGVERREQFHVLRHCEGIDLQGYLFARPSGAEEILEACAALPVRLEQLIEEDDTAVRARNPAVGSILHWRGPPKTR